MDFFVSFAFIVDYCVYVEYGMKARVPFVPPAPFEHQYPTALHIFDRSCAARRGKISQVFR